MWAHVLDDILQACALHVLLMPRVRAHQVAQRIPALARDQPVRVQDVKALRRLLRGQTLCAASPLPCSGARPGCRKFFSNHPRQHEAVHCAADIDTHDGAHCFLEVSSFGKLPICVGLEVAWATV